MATERQIAANRANAKKSTGPKSRAGKSRSSQNAFVHGLTGWQPIDSDWGAHAERHARNIVDSTQGRIDMAHALSVAQAQLELVRARSTSSAIFGDIYPASQTDGSAGTSSPHGAKAAKTKVGVLSLRVLDRYEHRALLRRNAAIRRCFEDWP